MVEAHKPEYQRISRHVDLLYEQFTLILYQSIHINYAANISLHFLSNVLFYHNLLGARSKSLWLRGHVNNTISQNANNMHQAWNSTNSALQQRISETRVAKETLQSHLDKTSQEILDQDKEISSLTKALREKEAPLKV